MKKISIEIPTCTKNTFEKRIEGNLKTFSSIADKISFNILFQKEYTEEDLEKYQNMFNVYGIEHHFKLVPNDYNGYLVKMRYDCHNLNNENEYILFTDDDVEYHSEFVQDILKALEYFDREKNVYGLVFDNFYYRRLADPKLKAMPIFPRPNNFKVWTCGGILAKNFSNFFSEFDLEYQGVLEDNMIANMLEKKGGFSICRTHSYKHYEFRTNPFDCGHYRHQWYRFDKHKTLMPSLSLPKKKEDKSI